MTDINTEVTKAEFESYVDVQESGATNMFAVNTVCELSGLEKEKVLNIMKNYRTYKEKYQLE